MTPDTPMRLAPNTVCIYAGQTFRVVERHDQSQVIEFQREGDGEKFIFTDRELWRAWYSREFTLVQDQPLLPIPLDQEGPGRVNPTLPDTSERNEKHTHFLRLYMEAWAELELGRFQIGNDILPASKSTNDRMRVAHVVAEQHGHPRVPGHSTLARHYRKYRLTQDFRALESRHDKKGNRSPRFKPAVEEIIESTIKEYHLTPSPKNFTELTKTIGKRVQDHFVAEGMPPENARKLAPSIPTVTKRVRAIPASIRTRAQLGYVKAHRDHHVFRACDDATFPLQFVEADHTGFPTIAIDSITNLVIGPTRLTLTIDRYSSCILAAHLYFDDPSFDSISLTLRDTLLPKEDAATRFNVDLRNRWNQFGVPHRLCIDGGADFAGKDLSEACYRLGINIVGMPRKAPWFKGAVESFIKTLKTHFAQTYPGTPAYNLVKKLGLPDPEDYRDFAVMTICDLKRALVKWIVDVYHQEPHPHHPKTRQQVWDEGISIGMVPPPDPAFIHVATGRTRYGTLQHYGVQYNRLKYQSPELGKIRSFLEGGKSTKVKFVYYPEDCTRIDVQDPRTNEMIPAFANRRTVLEGMSHWQWNVLRRQFDSQRDENINHLELAESRREIEEMVDEVMNRKRSTNRRKAAAFMASAQKSEALPSAAADRADGMPHTYSDPVHRSSAPPLDPGLEDDRPTEADNESDGWGGDYNNPRI